jgi:transposase-like protein
VIVCVLLPAAVEVRGFQPEVIVLVVRWYLRFGLSYRDVEELLAERGIDVDHVTVHPLGAAVHPAAARRGLARPTPGRRPLARGRDLASGKGDAPPR